MGLWESLKLHQMIPPSLLETDGPYANETMPAPKQ
jgi:hypothetical protein